MALYVDNLIITRNNLNPIFGLKKQLAYTFEMTNLGIFHFFLSIQVLQINDGISQPKYALYLLNDSVWMTISRVVHLISRA